jgi:NAD(P)-dependent dehydrogenase (short-subunit alcohol dehydrogenase family)
MGERGVAFITGASRGIGKASALALARKGFDVVVTARTLEHGEAFEHGSRDSEVRALPGSLRETARAVEALGQRALPLRLDLLDLDSIDAALEAALTHWGRIDLLVNNGIYQGPGTMNPVAELTRAQMQTLFQGNVFSQVHLVCSRRCTWCSAACRTCSSAGRVASST